jgi:hypothetical protein
MFLCGYNTGQIIRPPEGGRYKSRDATAITVCGDDDAKGPIM